jgi:hypothetical protein
MPLAPLSMVSSSTAGMASQIWEPDWLVYTKGVVFVSDDFHCVNSFFLPKLCVNTLMHMISIIWPTLEKVPLV